MAILNKMMMETFEPKYKRQFQFVIDGIPAFLIKEAKRPSISNEVTTVDFMNKKKYFKGKTEYGTLDITVLDSLVPSGAQAVVEWIRLHHETMTGRDGYSTVYKKDFEIRIYGPGGDQIQSWKFKGGWITECNFGDLSWAEGGILQISMTLRFDDWYLEY